MNFDRIVAIDENNNLPDVVIDALVESTQLNAAFVGRTAVGEIPPGIVLPSELSFITPTFLETPRGIHRVGSIGETAPGMFGRYSPALSDPDNVFWVDVATGSDSNDGSEGSPVFSLFKAKQLVNSAVGTSLIYVKSGNYSRPAGFTNTSGDVTSPNKDVAFVAYDGPVIVGPRESISGFAVNGTYANTYSKTVTNCTRVVDITRSTVFGDPVELLPVSTPARCNITPDSWCYSGGTLFINRLDGAAPSNVNTRYYRTFANFSLTNEVNVFMGSVDGSPWILEGGSGDAFGVAISDPTPGEFKAVVLDGVTARFAGQDGFGTNAFPGVVAAFNCHAAGNAKDAFNASGTVDSFLLTSNCRGVDSGRAGLTSCNGWTLHANATGMDVAGVYQRNRGGTVRNIDSTKAYLFGTLIADDQGDQILGGSLEPTGIRAEDSATIWGDRVIVDQPAGGFAYTAEGGTIHLRDATPGNHRILSGGTIDTY